MSAALVRKSLALIDDSFQEKGKHRRNENVFSQLMPDSQKIKRQIVKKGRKVQKVNLLQTDKKFTITEAKKTQKSKESIRKSNLEKLRLVKEACKIDLEAEITERLIERAVTKRPVNKKKKPKKPQQTAFTEEDFKKFEEEYFDEDL